jgi:hypothetical protein
VCSGNGECQLLSLCKAVREAAYLGNIGAIIVKVGSLNASGWLMNQTARMEKKVTKAGNEGVEGMDCNALYECKRLPAHYKFPGVTGTLTREEIDSIAGSILALRNIFHNMEDLEYH